MKILITGGTGFVGTNLINLFNKTEHDISVLSRTNGEFVGDLNDNETLSVACQNKDVVVHLAGVTEGNVFDVNTQGTKNLVNACKKNNVKRIVFLSTFNVSFDNEYGKSKRKAEQFVIDSGIEYFILRPTVIYGRYNETDIAKIVGMIKKFPIVPIFESGKMQPLFVEDLCEVIVKCLVNEQRNKIYFIGGRDKLTFTDIVETILNVLGKKRLKIKIPKFFISFLKKELLLDRICDNHNVEKDFGIKLKGFKEGLLKMWA